MKIQFYLIVKKNGGVRTTKNPPSIEWDEIFMLISMNVGDNLFRRPMLQANIELPDKTMPVEINAEVVADIENIVQERTGYEIKLEVIQPEE